MPSEVTHADYYYYYLKHKVVALVSSICLARVSSLTLVLELSRILVFINSESCCSLEGCWLRTRVPSLLRIQFPRSPWTPALRWCSRHCAVAAKTRGSVYKGKHLNVGGSLMESEVQSMTVLAKRSTLEPVWGCETSKPPTLGDILSPAKPHVLILLK